MRAFCSYSFFRVPAVAAGLAFAGFCGTSSAAPYVGEARESFNYTAGTALPAGTTTTGSGFGTATWGIGGASTDGTSNILGSSLSFPAIGYDPSLAGSLSLSGATERTERSLGLGQSVDSGELWFSFLIQGTTATDRTLDLVLDGSGVDPSFGRSNTSGAALGQVSMNFNGTITAGDAPISMGTGVTHLIIGRVEFNVAGADDRVSMWVDPASVLTLDTATPHASNAAVLGDVGAISGFILRAPATGGFNNLTGSTGTFDEIRFGTTLASVTVPEPASATLAAAGVIAFLAFSRRRS